MDAEQADRAAEAAALAYDEEMNRSPFPEEAWEEIFSTVPDYPTDLPDDVVRYIADLAIHVRELAMNLGPALASGDRLRIFMGTSLATSPLENIKRYILSKIERGEL